MHPFGAVTKMGLRYRSSAPHRRVASTPFLVLVLVQTIGLEVTSQAQLLVQEAFAQISPGEQAQSYYACLLVRLQRRDQAVSLLSLLGRDLCACEAPLRIR
jgi:hypothetical protein